MCSVEEPGAGQKGTRQYMVKVPFSSVRVHVFHCEHKVWSIPAMVTTQHRKSVRTKVTESRGRASVRDIDKNRRGHIHF